MKRVARHKRGSVVFDRRRKTWNFLRWVDGRRRTCVIGSLQQFPTKGAAWRAAEALQDAPAPPNVSTGQTVRGLAQRYEAERLPSRRCTARMYSAWLRNYILPEFGDKRITDIQPRPVELWLRQLPLSPKSKAHIRGMLHLLMEFAMWAGILELSRNPIDLVVVKGASKRTRKPRSLTVEEFQRLSKKLQEPFRTMALVCVCFGLRISECLGLRWSDVNWLEGTLSIQRSIVAQRIEDTKTESSRKALTIAREVLETLMLWKHETQFSAESDWIFASPRKLGRLPFSYNCFWREVKEAGCKAEIGDVATHTFRHTYRSWLDSVGTPVGVQQRLMRHSDIRTTLNQYGDVLTDDMRQAQEKVGKLAFRLNLNGSQADCGSC